MNIKLAVVKGDYCYLPGPPLESVTTSHTQSSCHMWHPHSETCFWPAPPLVFLMGLKSFTGLQTGHLAISTVDHAHFLVLLVITVSAGSWIWVAYCFFSFFQHFSPFFPQQLICFEPHLPLDAAPCAVLSPLQVPGTLCVASSLIGATAPFRQEWVVDFHAACGAP